MNVEPIDQAQRQLVIAATEDYVHRASDLLDRSFAPVPVAFDLTGRAAGMYRVRWERRLIRYNPYIFAKYFDDNLAVTVPHEVAHYVTDIVHGLKNIRPHGRQWQALMAAFGAEASRTCSYDLTGVPLRRHKRHSYRCACTTHQLTSRRHNKLQRNQVRYLCRYCGGELALMAP